MNTNKNSFNLNTMTDTIKYCRDNGWLDPINRSIDMDEQDDILLLKKTRNQLKKRSKSYHDGYYINSIYLNKGDIVKISINVCEILDYNIYTKKHTIKILSHPLMRITNVYLKLTNFKLISTVQFRNSIRQYNKKYLYHVIPINNYKKLNVVNIEKMNKSGSSLNIITYKSFEPVEYDIQSIPYVQPIQTNKSEMIHFVNETYNNIENNIENRRIAKQLCSEIIKNSISKLSQHNKLDIKEYINENEYSDDFESDSECIYDDEVIFIQKHIRGYITRCRYTNTLKAVHIIQRFIKKKVLNELDMLDEEIILEAVKQQLNKESEGYGCIVM